MQKSIGRRFSFLVVARAFEGYFSLYNPKGSGILREWLDGAWRRIVQSDFGIAAARRDAGLVGDRRSQ
ncbi:hypothetical protein VOM14_05255 [Paraburkholderia sp. MPAMCS5]|uniref:hypothetical protein n=1 Tax=Paraburkholderia sp. MPAMCS5 TaxID=3112563 RepID=UPI002E17792E|nr:hypothetical protein [Paraburkholderia sp. MPAMCS5]